MAVRALHGMDIVPAGRAEEGSVHFLDVEAAVGQAGMTVGAGGPGLLAVLQVTSQTA